MLAHDRPAARGRWSRPLLAGSVLLGVVLGACSEVVVEPVAVESVEVTPTSLELVQGDAAPLEASVRGASGRELSGRAVTWSTADSEVATVDGAGVVEALAPGTTRITASISGVQGSSEVTVSSAPMIRLSAISLTLSGVAEEAGTVERDIAVTNGGGGSLEPLSVAVLGQSGGSAGWLEAELLGDASERRIRARATARRLEPGTHEAAIRVESAKATNSPVEVRVRFAVSAPEDPGGPPGSDPDPDDGPSGPGPPDGPPGPGPPDPGEDDDPDDPDDSGEGDSDYPVDPPEAPGCEFQNENLDDDVEIGPDESCSFVNVRIRGNLSIRAGATVTASRVRIDGNVEATSAAHLQLVGARVDGNLQFREGGSAELRESDIRGNAELESSEGPLRVDAARIRGNASLEENRGGPFTLHGVRVDGNLSCHDNEPPPTTSGLDVRGNREGQC